MKNRKPYISIIILIIFFILFYLPIINIFFQSFIFNKKIDFSGFKELFEDKEIIYSFLNSIFIALITIAITLFISLKAIKDFFFNQNYLRIFFLTFLNLILPETVLAVSLLLFFSALNITLNIYTLIIGHILLSLGYIVPLLFQKCTDMNKLYFAAAYDLGASKNYAWQTIVKPLLKPTIIFCCFLTFILSFDDYVFSFFCSSIETLTISNPLLALLRTGLNLKIKALFVFVLFFSFSLGFFYLSYIGFNDEK